MKQLTCACCGGPAPAIKQWHNQDLGFGCCARCVERITAKKGEAYMLHCYGRKGVHHTIAARNTRFWVFVNGDCAKLTLRPGALLRWEQKRHTEEGWYLESCCWEIEDGYVLEEWAMSARDCDGKHACYGIRRKECRPIDVYDQYARMAGY